MKTFCVSLTLFATLLTACHRSEAPPTPLSVDQIPATVEQAFSQSDPANKTAAGDVADAIKTQDPDRALGTLQVLSAQPGLTPAQHAATAQAIASFNQYLQGAAANGDAKAAAALARYRATK